MFRQRTSTRKPGDELVANFRQQFPEVSSGTSASGTTAAPAPAPNITAPHPPPAVPSISEKTVPTTNGAQLLNKPNLGQSDAFRDQDPTPRATAEPWRFTPSLLDPGSFSFSTFTSQQPPGYYTPTPGGTNTLYHPQAGDLHTPTLSLSMGLGTPLSLPTSDGNLQSGAPMMDVGHFPPHSHVSQPTTMAPQHFHAHAHQHQPQFTQHFASSEPAARSFAPSSFVHHDTGYETMDQDDGSPPSPGTRGERLGSMDAAFHSQSPSLDIQQRHFGMTLGRGLSSSTERFRFQATLNAPTAMIRHADEIPVTYLNKGQVYTLSVVDTDPPMHLTPGTRYRTFIRVSFEDELQRQKPSACWNLWKEGRGTNEAHQRGGKLQAVEYVDSGPPADGDDKRTYIELDTSSFDGFSVFWMPGANGTPECSVTVRFNFLSTDFSHSKGVKGIPVRLCAKTVILPPSNISSPLNTASEICYGKVKLFRDHGAERKLSNDVAHVRKLIDKLKQQIVQAENGAKDFTKRKRGSVSQMKDPDSQGPGKAPKHKRTWSMSSTSSAGGGNSGRCSLDEDLQIKLRTLQDMFSSTRPASVLHLRGDELDDPDLHPVSLTGEPANLVKPESKDESRWHEKTSQQSSLVSPSPSAMSLQSQPSVGGANAQWSEPKGTANLAAVTGSLSEHPTKVLRSEDAGDLRDWIEVLGVDPSYRPPADISVKPVACLYVARLQSTAEAQKQLHRAVYLTTKTLQEFIIRVCAKWNIDHHKVARAVRTLSSGLEIEIDDDVIRELSEGQDMTMEVNEVERKTPQPTQEWEMAIDAPDGEPSSAQSGQQATTSHELRFRF